MADVVAAFDQEADDGDGVGHVEEDDAGRYHAVGNHISVEESCSIYAKRAVERLRSSDRDGGS